MTKKFANVFELLAVTEAEIEMRVVFARRAAKVREELAWAEAIHGTNEEWRDYLHERRVSADLNLTVCEPQ